MAFDTNTLIFGRYTREQCGLPPRPLAPPARSRVWLRALMLVAAVVAAGWAAGGVTARWRTAWLEMLPGRLIAADAAERSRLLAEGRMHAEALPDQPGPRRSLALAAYIAADNAPRRMGYYANAANLARAADGDAGNSGASFFTDLHLAFVHEQVEDFPAALAALGRAEKTLEDIADPAAHGAGRLLLANAKAYFYATFPPGAGGDAKAALRLAETMITSRDLLPDGSHPSDSAALLDTLAAAYHANALHEQALAAQTIALGLADSGELDVYLRHYDDFAGDAMSHRQENDDG